MPRPALISTEELADAVGEIVVESGLGAVSMRTVAARAKVSTGAVQHHFASKDELLAAAYRRVIEGFRERARSLPDQQTEPVPYLGGLLTMLLPTDRKSEAELRIAIAFSARSLHNAALAELYEEGYRALLEAASNAVAGAITRGEADPGIDPRRFAARALALVDGLAWHALCAPGSADVAEAKAILDEHLATTLGGKVSADRGRRRPSPGRRG